MAVPNLGKVKGFKPFCTVDVLNHPEGVREKSEPCYTVVVHHRTKSWAPWRPRSVEDVPPLPDDGGLYRRCRSFGEALSIARRLNSQWLGSASEPGPGQWAIVASVEGVTPKNTATLRCVTPLAYRSREIRVKPQWTPTHLLENPLCPWKAEFSSESHLAGYDTFEIAVHEVVRRNRLKCPGGPIAVDSWHILIALESHALSERLEYRCWNPNVGVMSLESSRRFHIFDRASWPVPDCMNLDLDGPSSLTKVVDSST